MSVYSTNKMKKYRLSTTDNNDKNLNKILNKNLNNNLHKNKNGNKIKKKTATGT